MTNAKISTSSDLKDKGIILITGSSGLVGRELQKNLLTDYQVVGMDLHAPEDPLPDSAWIKCDLTKDQSVAEALRRVRETYGNYITAVVHLAAYYDFSGEPSPLYQELTVEGTKRLLLGLREFEVGQFVFSSSLLVMDPVKEGEPPLTEQDETRAEWDYPRSKLDAEQVILDHHGKVPAVILRLAGVYDGQCHSLPLSQQIRRIYEKQLEGFVFPGDTTHGQPFIHLKDVASCVRRVIEMREKLEPVETFLIAETGVMGYGDLQDKLGQLIHGKEWPAIRIPKPVAKAGAWVKEKLPGQDPFIRPWMIDLADDQYPVDIRRAREKLHWAPRHYLEDVLPEMVSFLQRDPVAFYKVNKLPLPDDWKPPSAEGKEPTSTKP